MLQSYICEYSDAYVVMKGTITVEGANDRDMHYRSLFLKNNAPFISCVSKINGALIGNIEGLDMIIPMYNLI